MSETRVLVTGASGFIGRNVVESLARMPEFRVSGTYLHAPVEALPPAVSLRRADLCVQGEADRILEGVDVLVQAAATTSGVKDNRERPHYHVTDNAVMNSLLFRAAHERGVRHVIFFSCTTMYRSSDRPVSEDDFDHRIESAYFGVGWTKVYLEKMCEFFSRLGRTRFTVVRHSNVYGPHDKFDSERSHVFAATVTKVLRTPDGEPVVVWGDGSDARDLLHVDDLVDFVVAAIRRQETPFELVNVGVGSAISVRDLVGAIIARSGRALPIRFDPGKPSLGFRLAVDCTRARERFGWRPLVPLEEGIDRTLRWYREHRLQPAG